MDCLYVAAVLDLDLERSFCGADWAVVAVSFSDDAEGPDALQPHQQMALIIECEVDRIAAARPHSQDCCGTSADRLLLNLRDMSATRLKECAALQPGERDRVSLG